MLPHRNIYLNYTEEQTFQVADAKSARSLTSESSVWGDLDVKSNKGPIIVDRYTY